MTQDEINNNDLQQWKKRAKQYKIDFYIFSYDLLGRQYKDYILSDVGMNLIARQQIKKGIIHGLVYWSEYRNRSVYFELN